MRIAIIAGLVMAMSGCSDALPGLTFDILALTGAGADPFEDREFDRVQIRVQQEGSEVINLEAATSGTFDLSTVFESLSAPTRVRLKLEGDGILHGAPPLFAPGASQGIVRFAVGEPSTCERIAGFDRDSAPGASYSRIDTFILGAGGDGSDSVWIFDLLRLATTELDPLPDAGPTESTTLGSSSALIVSDAGAYRYDLSVNPEQDERAAELVLHDGANHTTVLLTRENGGALAVGPGRGFSLVAPDGRVIRGQMPFARTRPGLIEIGGSLLIIGGNTEGALIEVVDVDRGETTPLGDGTLPPSVAALRVDNDVWLLHDDGTTSTISGCPACDEPAGGEDLEVSLAGPQHVVVDNMLSAVTGDEGDMLNPVASALMTSTPRALFAYESGIVFLADEDGAQLCFPMDLLAL